MKPRDVTHALNGSAPFQNRVAILLTSTIVAAWTAIVAATVRNHEFWRDEVNALSLALGAPSLLSVPAAVHGEGHPSLWYLLLRAAYDFIGVKTVLPLVAAAIAAISVAVFLWRAPFPLWWKGLFVFGLPLYEYSVMARNYGISMLLMLLFALFYTQAKRSPLLLGIILFLLANTNLHSAFLTPLFVFVWYYDVRISRGQSAPGSGGTARESAGMLVALSGLLACFLTVYPSKHDLYAESFVDRSLIASAIYAVAVPGRYFGKLFPFWPSSDLLLYGKDLLVTAMLYLSVIGLVSRIPLFIAGVAALWLLSFFFAHVYGGAYRHQGLWIVFMISLYWIALRREPVLSIEKRLSRTLAWAHYGVLPIILLAGISVGFYKTSRDIKEPASQSKAVAALLLGSPEFNNAIVLAEPDYLLEALAYYTDHDTYLLREARFGKSVTFTRRAKLEVTLSDVLSTAIRLKATSGRPVVLLIGHQLEKKEGGGERLISFSYGWQFRYTREEVRAFEAATMRLASLRNAISDEKYDVYALK